MNTIRILSPLEMEADVLMKRITKFSQITEQLPYPAGYRGILQDVHATIVVAVLNKGSITRSFGKQAVHIVNLISYRCINQEHDLQWDHTNPLSFTGDDVEDDVLQSYLGDMYLVFKYIKWEHDGLELVSESDTQDSGSSNKPVTSTTILNQKVIQIKSTIKPSYTPIVPTPKEDLSIQPPVVPQFNFNSVKCAAMIGDRIYTIYESLPIIPKTQNQISVTTDITKMSREDFRNLYPNCRVSTRNKLLYDPHYSGELKIHPVLGVIIPVEGFTEAQIIDNIIKYPHLYKLSKMIDGEIAGFYSTIEINGELKKTLEVWNSLPESSSIPYIKEYVREYVIRRYLLERDIKGIKHKYPLFGTLDPFLTLFTTPDEYLELGYTDIEGMARQCVKSRISYKKSRNPILRLADTYKDTPGCNICVNL